MSTVAEDEQEGPLSALAKGLLVMEALVEAGRPLPLSAVVARTELPKATAHRAVRVLVQRGWAQQTDHGYWLGNRLLQAASAFEGSLDLRRETRPALEMLRDEFDETVHLATLDQDYRVIYLEKLVPASQVVGLVRGSGVGYTAPAYCTGVGKAMLAFLSPEELDKFFAMTQLVALTPHTLHTRADLEASLRRARRKGYATDNEEHEPGVACIGAPILGRRGEVVAAISVAGPVSRMKQHLRDSKSGGRLCEVASTMSGLLGHGKGA